MEFYPRLSIEALGKGCLNQVALLFKVCSIIAVPCTDTGDPIGIIREDSKPQRHVKKRIRRASGKLGLHVLPEGLRGELCPCNWLVRLFVGPLLNRPGFLGVVLGDLSLKFAAFVRLAFTRRPGMIAFGGRVVLLNRPYEVALRVAYD
jgi:hypothetical protein